METLTTTRIKMNEVLFATDLSSTSDAALNSAANVAKAFESRLSLLHVVPAMIYPSGLAAGFPEVQAAPREIALEILDAVEQSPLLQGIRRRTMVRDGFASAMIRSVVEDEGIDLVVVGTHGAHGVEKALLGSVAEEVFRSVTCPVMTVGPNVKENYEGKFDSILFATDLSLQSLRAAQYAISWALETQAHLTLLHVISDHLYDCPTDETLERQRQALSELRSWIPEDAAFWCEPQAEVAFGDPETEILAVSERHKTNLIAMSVRKAGVLASHAPWALASNIVQNAKCPVLTVRDHYGD